MKPRARAKESGLYDAMIDEFLPWIEENHDERHRRMDKLHEDLGKAHQTSSGAEKDKRS